MRLTDPNRRRLRLFVIAALLALGATLLMAGGAFADALTPESGGSPNADRIDTLYKIALVIGAVVFFGVEGALIYALMKFRAKKGAVPAQIRGNTNLEIGWTVGAAVVLIALAVVTFVALPGIKNPPRSDSNGLRASTGDLYASVDQPNPPGSDSLKIDVNGQQYIWRYTYPNGVFAYETMVVPVHTTVVLNIVAQDVAHSWWIPKLGGKFDAIPGTPKPNKTWFKIAEPGVYHGQCAELCGRNHANMVATVKAVSVADYQAWIAKQKADIDQANALAAKERSTLSPTESAPPAPTPTRGAVEPPAGNP